MDLLRTILIYLTMVYATSVESAPEFTIAPVVTATPSAIAATATLAPAATQAATETATVAKTPVPTPDITPNKEYKTLKVGDSGERVITMQRRLAELGYYAGDIDGRFGNQTRRAVESFQYNNGLSSDGIAGKRTLTVLYESKTVVAITPEATATSTPAQAQQKLETAIPKEQKSDTPTQAPTFIPTMTPAPEQEAKPKNTAAADTAAVQADATEQAAETPTEAPPEESAIEPSQEDAPGDEPENPNPQDTPIPSEEPEVIAQPSTEPVPLEIGFVLEGETKPMTAEVSVAGSEPQPLMPMEAEGKVVYVPFLSILENAGILVIPSVTPDYAEYAFALQADFYHLSYEPDEHGAVSGLEVSSNGEPQIMTNRQAFLKDGILYLPLLEMEKWTGIIFALNEETMMYTVFLPAAEE